MCLALRHGVVCQPDASGRFGPSAFARTPGVTDLSPTVDTTVCAVWGGGRVRCFSPGLTAEEVLDTDVHGLDDAVRVEVLSNGHGACAIRRGGALSCWEFPDARARQVELPVPVVAATSVDDDLCVISTSGAYLCAKRFWPLVDRPPRWTDPLENVGRARCTFWEADGVECVVETEGALFWGIGDRNGLPGGMERITRIPEAPVERGFGVGFHCDLGADRTVRCRGTNEALVLGSTDRSATETTPALPAPAVELQVGSRLSCVLHPDDRVSCWGDNRRGQIDPSSTSTWIPEPTLVRFSGLSSH